MTTEETDAILFACAFASGCTTNGEAWAFVERCRKLAASLPSRVDERARGERSGRLSTTLRDAITDTPNPEK